VFLERLEQEDSHRALVVAQADHVQAAHVALEVLEQDVPAFVRRVAVDLREAREQGVGLAVRQPLEQLLEAELFGSLGVDAVVVVDRAHAQAAALEQRQHRALA
jgi:hypothetical protein